MAGLSIAPAIGDLLAQSIVDGRPAEDLEATSIARFGLEWRDDPRLCAAAAWKHEIPRGAGRSSIRPMLPV